MFDLGKVLLSFREIVSEEMPRLCSWTQEQKQILWNNTINHFLRNNMELPGEVIAIQNYDFKLNLAYDRTICKDLGINYTEIDKYWDDIRASIALRYFDF